MRPASAWRRDIHSLASLTCAASSCPIYTYLASTADASVSSNPTRVTAAPAFAATAYTAAARLISRLTAAQPAGRRTLARTIVGSSAPPPPADAPPGLRLSHPLPWFASTACTAVASAAARVGREDCCEGCACAASANGRPRLSFTQDAAQYARDQIWRS
jgi:hypothetical protein